MIGIFDSGIGGLTIVKKIKEKFPQLSFIYLGDNARTPYGNRSQETIIKYAQEDIEFLISHQVQAVIIACNTVSALAGDFLKKKYNLPIFEVISPAVHQAIINGGQRIGVIGTRATINSLAHQKLLQTINPQLVVFNQACPLFVPLVEENWIKRLETEMIARRYLIPLKNKQIDTLILGCTHYPLLKEVIQHKIGKSVKLIDPAEAVVNLLAEYLKNHIEIDNSGKENYFVTDLDSHFQEIANRWLNKSIIIKKTEL